MNLHTLEWDQDLLELLRIPRALLPEIRSSSEVYGSAVGDLSGVPVAGVLGDQSASLFGHTCFDHGDMKAPTAREPFCCSRSERSRCCPSTA